MADEIDRYNAEIERYNAQVDRDNRGHETLFSDAERQLLVVLVSKALVDIRHDSEMKAEAKELEDILRKLNGVDKLLVVRS